VYICGNKLFTHLINHAEQARCIDRRRSKGRLTVILQRKGVLQMINLEIFCLVRIHIEHFVTNANWLKSLEYYYLAAFIAKKIHNSMLKTDSRINYGNS
jgi:hypothetical protein